MRDACRDRSPHLSVLLEVAERPRVAAARCGADIAVDAELESPRVHVVRQPLPNNNRAPRIAVTHAHLRWSEVLPARRTLIPCGNRSALGCSDPSEARVWLAQQSSATAERAMQQRQARPWYPCTRGACAPMLTRS